MWLILCDANDQAALWAGAQLRRLGLNPLQIHTLQELQLARKLEYRSVDGTAFAFAELEGERTIDTRHLHGVLNRAVRGASPQIALAQTADRGYIHAEMDAIVWAWLATLPASTINLTSSSAWSGVQLSTFAWAQNAQLAGFATLPHRSGYLGLEYPSCAGMRLSTHLIFANRCFPNLPPPLHEAARKLAQRVAVPLLGITLGWKAPSDLSKSSEALFIDANSVPDLRIGGMAFIAELANAMPSQSPAERTK